MHVLRSDVFTVHCACQPSNNLLFRNVHNGRQFGDVAIALRAKNHTCYAAAEEVLTGIISGTEKDKKNDHTEEEEVEHTYKVLPFEANEMCQENAITCTHGGQENAAYVSKPVTGACIEVHYIYYIN